MASSVRMSAQLQSLGPTKRVPTAVVVGGQKRGLAEGVGKDAVQCRYYVSGQCLGNTGLSRVP